jgi:hypothetical protein
MKIGFEEIKLESYSDYPQSVKDNAKSVLKWVEENGWGSCGTPVGKIRANQLANGEPISLETIKRMYSYLSRHEVDLESSKSYSDGCGKLMYDSWGGKEALTWSKSKINSIELEDIMEFIYPNSGESKDEFIPRCMSSKKMIGEYPEQDQRYAVCISNYSNKVEMKKWRMNDPNSSNVKKVLYNDETMELVIKFINNEIYTYPNVDFTKFRTIMEGAGICRTEGQNKWGSWYVGKTPSIGAAVYDMLVINNTPFVKGGSFRGDKINMNKEDFKMNSKTFNGKKLKRFVANEDDELSFVANSLVNEPAIGVDFIWFSADQEIKSNFQAIEEKGLISGPSMIANLPIYRIDPHTKEEYYGYFTEEDIYNCLVTLQKRNKQSTINLSHNQTEFIDGVFLLEVFQIDSKRGINSPKGFNLPDGSLFTTYKCENDEVWKMIKDGTFKGFSIEGYYETKEVIKEKTLIEQLIEISNLL